MRALVGVLLSAIGVFVVANTVGGEKLSHEEVVRVAESSAAGLGRLLSTLAPDLAERA